MTDPATGQRSFLQALKVPFDLKGVGAGALAFLALVLGARALGVGLDQEDYVRKMLQADTPFLRSLGIGRPDHAAFWKLAGLHFAVAAILGVACCRIAGLRLARDEGVGLGEAVGFALKNLGATVGAMLFMAASIGLFYSCNALAGVLSGIPGIGPFLMIVLWPLALLSSLLLFLLAFGTVFGLPLVFASLAVERNGALDAVSRAFSYVFSRPVLFFLYAFTIAFIAVVLASCALQMELLALRTFRHWFPSGEAYVDLGIALERGFDAARALEAPDMGALGGLAALQGWIAWAFGALFHLALMGWVMYYAWGGATAAYFALRADVDGTEDEEIWLEGEQGETFGEPERPAPPAAAAEAPAPSPAPAPPPPAPPPPGA